MEGPSQVPTHAVGDGVGDGGEGGVEVVCVGVGGVFDGGGVLIENTTHPLHPPKHTCVQQPGHKKRNPGVGVLPVEVLKRHVLLKLPVQPYHRQQPVFHRSQHQVQQPGLCVFGCVFECVMCCWWGCNQVCV